MKTNNKILKLSLAILVALGISGCGNLQGVIGSPAQEQQKQRTKSEYPQFSEAFMAKMPPVQDGSFFSDLRVSFQTYGLAYQVSEFKRNTDDLSYKELVNKYLVSGLATNNTQYKAFMQTAKELNLNVKKYRNGIWNILAPNLSSLVYRAGGKMSNINGLDYVYIAFDENKEIKAIFTYEHIFFFGSLQTQHEQLWALVYFGSSAIKAQQILNNDILDKFEVK